jgi:two-component system cell cycle response regulator
MIDDGSNDNGKRPADRTASPDDLTQKRRIAPWEATLPPAGLLKLPPTEDEIAQARPVCDRGTLTMINGVDAGAVYRLGPATLAGRSLDCQIHIEDVGVSRRHALIAQISESDYVVQDLGSRNGTTVHGRPITKCRLVDGDRVGIGPIFFRFTLADETEEASLRRRYEASIIDALTGAINRKHFDDRLVGELAYAKRHETHVSLLFMDVDHFKRVNDRFGHPAGDSVLRNLASTIRRGLRLEDIFARYGGEEFAIIARGIDLEHGLLLAERVRSLVESTEFAHQSIPIPLTISIGVACLADCPDASVDQLLASADAHLYAAKTAGRNCCRGS